MASILPCPECHSEVPLPDGPLGEFECPHCHKLLQVFAYLARSPDDIPPQQVATAEATTPEPITPAVTASQVRKALEPSNRPSAVGQVAGILLGSALGTVVGYWILNYLGGPRFDFLHIPLPLVPHTQPAPAAPQAAPLPSSPPSSPPSGPWMEEEPPPRQPMPAPSHDSVSDP
jgi:hypothetical protein